MQRVVPEEIHSKISQYRCSVGGNRNIAPATIQQHQLERLYVCEVTLRGVLLYNVIECK